MPYRLSVRFLFKKQPRLVACFVKINYPSFTKVYIIYNSESNIIYIYGKMYRQIRRQAVKLD